MATMIAATAEVSQPEAMAILGFRSIYSLRYARERGYLPARKANGKCWLFDLSAVLAYAEKRQARLAARAERKSRNQPEPVSER